MRPDSGDDVLRQALVSELETQGIRDSAVLEAMRNVPRHLFVRPVHRALAYANQSLPLTEGQTISQPFMVAFAAEALELTGVAGERVSRDRYR